MNTPTHLLLAAAVFAKPEKPRVTAAALLGGFAPDLSLYLLVGLHLLVLGTPPGVVFDELYFSDAWQRVFAVDNSFFVWGAALAVAWLMRSEAGIAFAGSGLLHLAFDFPVHHDDARPHFWPLTMWKFESPISYWDSAHYGNVVAPLEALLVLALCLVLWRRFEGWLPRMAVATTGALTLAPFVLFGLVMEMAPH